MEAYAVPPEVPKGYSSRRFSRRWIEYRGIQAAADSVANHQTNSGRLRLRRNVDYVCTVNATEVFLSLIPGARDPEKLQGFAIASSTLQDG